MCQITHTQILCKDLNAIMLSIDELGSNWCLYSIISINPWLLYIILSIVIFIFNDDIGTWTWHFRGVGPIVLFFLLQAQVLRAVSPSLELLNSESHAGVKCSSLSDSFDLKTNKCLLVFLNYDFLSVVKIILKYFMYLFLSTIIHFSEGKT